MNHPDWMYDLYRVSLDRLKSLENPYTQKPVAEREWVPLNFKWKDDPYSYFLEQKGLL